MGDALVGPVVERRQAPTAASALTQLPAVPLGDGLESRLVDQVPCVVDGEEFSDGSAGVVGDRLRDSVRVAVGDDRARIGLQVVDFGHRQDVLGEL